MNAGAVEELIAQGRVVARAQARLLELVLQVYDTAPDPRFGVDEVSFALTWTRAAADSQESLARHLICGLPEVFASLSAGDIDLPKARVFADVLQALDPQVAQQVAGQVLPVAPAKTTAQLRVMLHRRALAADPDHARKRRTEGERERRVIVEPAADGTATLTAFGLPPDRAQAAYERITAIAKARKLSGATATLDQLRADALLDLLDGTPINAAPGPRRGVVELLVGLQTLAGLDEQPGDLNGYGPVAADIARQCAAANLHAQWRFSVIDERSGQLLFHSWTRARPAPTPHPSHTPAPPPQARPTRRPPMPRRRRRASDAAQAEPPPRQRRRSGGASHSEPVPHPPGSSARPARSEPASRSAGNRARAAQAEPASRSARNRARAAQAEPVPCSAGSSAGAAQTVPVPRRRRRSGGAESSEPVPRWRRGPGGAAQSEPVPCPPQQDPYARFPNAAMTAWIRARDRTCRAPGCRIPARVCHLDHTTDYAKGGLTTHNDLGAACAHHHTMKHDGGWQLIQIQPGHFIWISPSGRIYHVGPEPP